MSSSANPAMPMDAGLLCDAWEIASQSGHRLLDYLSTRDASYEAHPDLYAERARRAELDCRAMLAATLAVLNELRDTGQGAALLGKLRARPATTEIDLGASMREAGAVIHGSFPRLSTGILALVAPHFDQIRVTVGQASDAISADVRLGDQTRRIGLPLATKGPRRGLQDFFGTGPNRVIFGTNRIVAPNDGGARDWYENSLVSMAFVREWAYRNARNAAELGPPAVRASGPIALLIIAAAVAIIIGGGAITGWICDKSNNQVACGLAEVLIPGGLLVWAFSGGGIGAQPGPNVQTGQDFGAFAGNR